MREKQLFKRKISSDDPDSDEAVAKMVFCDSTADLGNDEEQRQMNSSIVDNVLEADELICLRIRNIRSIGGSSVTKMCVGRLTTVGTFLNVVSSRVKIPLDELELVYQDRLTADIYMLSKLSASTTFADLHIMPSKTQEYTLSVDRKKKKRPKFYLLDDDEYDNVTDTDVVEQQPAPNASASFTIKSSVSPLRVNDYVGKEFVGLKNQKSTCYMNSLLQTLFFCPEFRNAVYVHEFPYDPKKKSVGAALQRLFLRLQFSNRSSIETDEITKTFGWKDYESSLQHDIEELYRIIMDLLSDEFRQSSTHSITDSLYGGVMTDYVECLTCQIRNDKRALFLAVHLPVRVFGKPLPVPTLEEAIRTFIQAELLTEGNKYKCDNCNCLVDAHKGLSFEQLPYFMCLQLQRSEFDYELMTRRKCSDKVCFPQFLNMNEFVLDKRSTEEAKESMVAAIELSQIRGDKYIEKRLGHSRPSVQLVDEYLQDQNYTTENKQTSVDDMLKQGPNVYQLLSVLIHRGTSSLAGHYYAYILDLETNRWYQFNDSSVRRILETDIEDTFGDSKGLSDDKDGVAYMLVYRKLDPTLNSLPLTMEELPPKIVDLWKNLEAEDKETHSRETFERNVMRTTVYTREPNTWTVWKRELILSKSDTMSQLALKCYMEFYPEELIDPHRIRLVRFNDLVGVMDLSYDGKEDMTLGCVYRRPIAIERSDAFMLEIRDLEFRFDVIQSNDIIFKMFWVKSASDTIQSIKEVHARPTSTIGELRKRISTLLNLPLQTLKLVVQIKDTTKVLYGDSLSLSTYGLGEFHELFAESIEGSDLSKLTYYVKNHYECFLFQVDCQMFATPYDADDINEPAPSAYSPLAVAPIVGKIEELEIDSTFNPGLSLEKLLENLDGSTCSSTSTDSQRTLVYEENKSVPSDPTEFLDFGTVIDSASEAEVEPQTRVECAEVLNCEPQESYDDGNDFYYRVVSELPPPVDGWKSFVVKGDRSMSLRYLSNRLQELMGRNESEFILYKVCNKIVEEIVDYSTILGDVEFELFKVKVARRLLVHEVRVNVFLLELEKSTDKHTFLKDVVLDTNMSVHDARVHIESALEGFPGFNQDYLKSYRLRKKNEQTPSRVMRDTQQLSEFFCKMHGDIFLQPLQGPDECIELHHCILVRRWNPSELLLAPPTEIVFKYDFTVSLEKLLLEKISDLFGITPDQLEVAVPDNEYPYNSNPIAIHEILTWFKLNNSTKKYISIHNDEAVIFVRDSFETLKILSPEIRRVFEEEALSRGGEHINSTPKRGGEVGLYINLSRTPPT